MNVLIINPPTLGDIRYIREGRCEQRLSSFQYIMPPISLPSIAALLEKENFKVKITECIGDNLNLEDIEREIKSFHPTLIIVNVSTATYYNDKKVITFIRNITPCHLTAIGIHVTALPENVLLDTALDSVVRGEPEAVCLSLAGSIAKGKGFKNIEGLSYKEKGKVVHNRRKNFIEDLNKLPFPARNLLNNRRYTLPVINRPYTLVISSRGCPYECIFCTARQYYGNKLRLRNPKNIIDEIEEIIRKFQITDIVMWSDTFNLVRDFVMDICDEIKKRNLSFNWMCNSRVDRIDEGMLSKMKEAGCSGISYGIESGNQSILDKAKKGVTLKQIEDAFKWTHRAGIRTLGHVILGLPGETKETIKSTLQFVKRLNPDYMQFYCAIPFPGTELYSLAKKNGWLITDDWSRFELNQAIIQTPQLSSDDLKKARCKAFLSFYARPSYIGNKLLPLLKHGRFGITCRQMASFLKEWIM